jgi:hypothetical protein
MSSQTPIWDWKHFLQIIKVDDFISLTEGAFFIKHSSPLHIGMAIAIIPNPIIKLKIIANFSVFNISYILDLFYP